MARPRRQMRRVWTGTLVHYEQMPKSRGTSGQALGRGRRQQDVSVRGVRGRAPHVFPCWLDLRDFEHKTLGQLPAY